MKAKKIKRYLEEFLNELDDIDDEKEIDLRSSTYRIEDTGRFFLGFVGYDGGYLSISDIEEQKENDDNGNWFADMDSFIDFLYDEELADRTSFASEDEVKMALAEIFYDQDIEILYNELFNSENEMQNIREIIRQIKEII